MATPKGVSNDEQIARNALTKVIDVEQTFATQVYTKFNSIKFGIDSCCYTDYVSAVLAKSLCDWKNSVSTKPVVSTETPGIYIEPLAQINKTASMACPATPSNVCTIVNLKELLGGNNTFTQCVEVASQTWTITHGLGRYPSVTVVDGQNEVVIGQIDYISSQQVQLTFSIPFAGCAFLN